MDVKDIKQQALDLSRQLAAVSRQLDDGSLALADVSHDFEEQYQPRALELIDEMTKLVPTETPGIIVAFSNGNVRSVSFSDRQSVELHLPNNEAEDAAIKAAAQFDITARNLQNLANALPEPIGA